jgi:hypothetical protein
MATTHIAPAVFRFARSQPRRPHSRTPLPSLRSYPLLRRQPEHLFKSRSPVVMQRRGTTQHLRLAVASPASAAGTGAFFRSQSSSGSPFNRISFDCSGSHRCLELCAMIKEVFPAYRFGVHADTRSARGVRSCVGHGARHRLSRSHRRPRPRVRRPHRAPRSSRYSSGFRRPGIYGSPMAMSARKHLAGLAHLRDGHGGDCRLLLPRQRGVQARLASAAVGAGIRRLLPR